MVSLRLTRLALFAGELRGDEEGLRQELLDLAGAGDDLLVVLAELVHAEDGDDVLQILVALERLLHLAGDRVVALADDLRVEHRRRRVERIHGGVDAELGDGAGEHRRGVEVGEGRRGRGIGEIVGGHVDGLNAGDRALGRRGDALLERAHLGGERGLVTDGARDTAEERGHLGAGLGEAEDVVDEEQHVLALFVAEVLGDGEGREGDAGAGSRGLVHLAVDQRGLRDDGLARLELGLAHLEEEVVAFAGALADAGEHGHAAVGLGDVVDELLDEHGLADAGAAEEADLAALSVGGEQVDDLDARLEDLDLRRLIDELRRIAVDGRTLGVDGAGLVDGLADDVEDAAEALLADGHHDGLARVLRHPSRGRGRRWSPSRWRARSTRRGAGRPRGRG
jgi:hypothetical protein